MKSVFTSVCLTLSSEVRLCFCCPPSSFYYPVISPSLLSLHTEDAMIRDPALKQLGVLLCQQNIICYKNSQ